ncbi:MAG TPA: glycosyltransferase [Terracidiphilus sp.]|jgi:peptidoglycan/xylan/chitin deacetylase (PgdA/CDA1 family)/glycosyltransferase involved in cell wall biosynthesis
MIKLSVIIPTYNRRHVLQRTLPALLAQDLAAEDYEIIIVMDGSTDGTAELLDEWRPKCAFRAMRAPHRGPSATRNVGVQASVGELVLFLDDDLMGAPDLLRQHCAAHLDSEPRVVHGPIYVAAESSKTIPRYYFETGYRNYYRSLNPDMELRYPEDFGPSMAVLSSFANSSLPRDVLLRCGGFDEEIRVSEDLELGLRLWKMGIPFRFNTAAVVHEYYVKTSREYLEWQAGTAAPGDLRICRKHPEYRPCSLLAPLAETRRSRRWFRRVLLELPISPMPLLSFPLRFETWFYRYAPMRRAGLRLLQIAERTVRLRSALRAAGSWKSLESEFGRQCPALMYHHVGPAHPGTSPEWTVSPEQFERQIRWLARRGYVGIRPSDWLRWRKEGTGLREKIVLLTFDDAYSDTAEYALPILRRYGFSAGVFVVTKRIGGTNTWDEAQGSGTLQLMTAEQIRFWAGQGIEFGAHGRTHADLTTLSQAECLEEIAGSKNDLADLLGSPVISFSYPYGNYNDTICELVRNNFDLAFGSEEGLNYLKGDPYLLRRVCIGPDDSLIKFGLSIRYGGLKRFRDLRVKLGVRTRLKSAFRRHALGLLNRE